MNQTEFITAIEAKPTFKKWAIAPTLQSTRGDIEHWHGEAFISTDDGVNVFDVWFMVDTVTGEANWQNLDTMDNTQNVSMKKKAVLETYLKANFDAFFLGNIDLDNNWAEAIVYTLTGSDLVKSTVLVFKKGSNPISHLNVI